MSPERQHYGAIPADQPGQESAPTPISVNDRVLAWITASLSPLTTRVPDRLLLPQIYPVLEVYRPILKFIDLPTPKLGIGTIAFNMPDGLMWEVLSLSFRFVASGVVANRAVSVNFLGRDQPGGQIPICITGGNFTHTANLAVYYCASPIGMVGSVLTQSFGSSNYDNLVMIPIPPRLTLRGAVKTPLGDHIFDQFSVNVINTDAADQLSQFRMVVLESPAIAG